MADAGARPLTVALLGCGTVGSQVVRLLRESADDLSARAGAPLVLTGVGVRDTARERAGVATDLLTDDLAALAGSGADVVVELLGGIEPARTLILAAMAAGSSVVTANKALLASHGGELHAAALKHEVDLYYEASVAGAIPLLRPLRESLAGDRVRRVLGIVNGTTNFILSKMDEEGTDYAMALKEAQALGYAEADPRADVEGADAAAKAAILAGLAFHTRVTIDDVATQGIDGVSVEDVRAARDMGFVVKLLAVAELTPDERGVVVRVHPAMVPRSHPLASVRDAFNAVFVEADAAGQVMFYGRGAGGAPTASAVLGDIVAVARNHLSGSRGPGESIYADLQVRPIADATTRYYVNLEVVDRPGVLAGVAQVFADNGVSIQTVRQDGLGVDARLVVRTHLAADAALSATIEGLRASGSVRGVRGVMRVEGEPGR